MTSIFSSGCSIDYPTPQDLHTQAVFPIIFDDSPDQVTAGRSGHGSILDEGLLAKADVQTALLSMSNYGKSQYSDSKDYERTRPSQDEMYLAYAAQPGLGQPLLPSSSIPYARHPDQVQQFTSALFQPRASFEAQGLPYSPIKSHQIPDVTSYAPQQGPQGTQVFVQLQSTYDLSSCTFDMMFATRRCPATLTTLSTQESYQPQYLLTVQAPMFSTTGWNAAQVPLRMQMHDGTGLDRGLLDVGIFTYTDAMQQPAQMSPQDMSRKRKISIDSAETSRLPAKRPSTQQLRPSATNLYGAQYYIPQSGAGYMQQSSLEPDSSVPNLLPPYSSTQSQSGRQPQESPRRVSHHLSTSSASSLSQRRGPSPQTPSWSPSNVITAQQSKSPLLTAPVVTRLSSVSSPSNSANPLLIRTSTLQQSPSPGPTPAGGSTPASFNPYAIYPHKAVLKISGDLDTMVDEWSPEEFDMKRRLVQFWRSQNGSTINTSFKPVAPEDRQPNSICISCIYWESKKECYVTSVDTIYLLESLVAVRFTVEEKNRIRRNLEGFRPMTVSKGKADSEEFFKLIMGFPNPKPRNIEKDVKVFPWKILAHALKKIIGKYSASYSSTASALSTAGNPSYGGAPHDDLGTDLLPTASPHSASDSVYAAGLPTTEMSPHGHLAIPYASSGRGMLQLPQSSGNAYQYAAQSQMGGSSEAVSSLDPVHRASWDFSPYMDNNAGSASTALHAMYYQPRNDGHEEASSTGYQMTHTSSGP